MGGAVTQGAACDNDVHEVFKAMGELVLTKAYIAETGDGHFECYNASCTPDGEGLVVTPGGRCGLAGERAADAGTRRRRPLFLRDDGRDSHRENPGGICAAERPRALINRGGPRAGSRTMKRRRQILNNATYPAKSPGCAGSTCFSRCAGQPISALISAVSTSRPARAATLRQRAFHKASWAS